MATPPKPRRRRWRSRLLRLSLSSAVLISVAILVLRSAAFSEWAATALAAYLESLTGESVIIGGLDIDPLQGRAAAQGIVVSHPGAPPGEGTVAAVEQVEARVSLRGGWPRLDTVTIDRPSVRLHIDDDGLREFRALTERPRSDAAPASAFPWARFSVRDADLTVYAKRGVVARLDGIQLTETDGFARLRLGGGAISSPQLTQNLAPVVLTGIAVSPQHISVPELRLQTEAVAISGRVAAQQGGPLRGLLDAQLDLTALSALLPEGQAINGTGLIEAELGGTVSEPRVEGAVLVQDGAVVRDDRVVQLGEELSAGWRISGRQIFIEPAVAHWAEGLVEARGSIDLGTMGFYGSISGEGLQLKEVLELAGIEDTPWVDMAADVELQLAGVLNPMEIAGSVSLAGARLEVAGSPIADDPERLLVIPRLWLDGELQLDQQSVTFLARSARIGDSRATLNMDMNYATEDTDGDLDLVADFAPIDLRDVRPLGGLDLVGRGPATVRVGGPLTGLGVTAWVDLDDFGFAGLDLADSVTGDVLSPDLQQLILPGFSATLGDSAYEGQLTMLLGTPVPEIDLQVLLTRGRLPDLIGVTVDIDGVDGAVDGVMSLQGPVDALDGEIRLSTADVDLYGEVFSDGEAIAWMEDGRFTLERLELRREREGRVESLFARGSVQRGYVTNVEVLSSGLRLESLDALGEVENLRGEVSLDARLGGTLQSLEPRGRLALRRTRVGQRTMPPSTVDFDTADGLLSFEGMIAEDAEAGTGMQVAGSLDLWDHQRYKVSAEMTDFPASALYSQAPDGTPITALVTGNLRLEGDLQSEAPRVLEAAVSQASLDWGGHALRSTEPWKFSQTDTRFSLEGLSLVDARGSTRFDFGGTGEARGRLMMSGNGVVDLDLLRMAVPGLQRAEGLASVNVSILRDGPGQPTQTVADVGVENALVQGTWFPHPIESMSVSLVASPDGYTIRQGRGRIGGGPLRFSGRVDAQGWAPTHYDLSADLADARVRYLDFLPAMTGDATISVDGPADDLLLSGTVNVDNMVFSERIDWESWILEVSGERLRDAVAEETAELFAMDVRIQADDTVRMRNNVADLTAGGALHLTGTTARPGMTGTIRAQPGGFVYLKERNFELQRAELNFVDPYSFDPDVDIAMSTDIRAREQDVEIEYQIRGQYSDWYAETRSDPPMSPADINALLVFGLTLEELERYGGLSSALVVEGGDLLASKFGIVEQVGEGIFQYELLRLDRVDLISGVSERSYSAVTSELRLLAEKDLDWGATLRLEQNLNRVSDTYISLEQKLARKLYLRGFYATEQQDRYLTIGGAYGVDVNVRWELD